MGGVSYILALGTFMINFPGVFILQVIQAWFGGSWLFSHTLVIYFTMIFVTWVLVFLPLFAVVEQLIKTRKPPEKEPKFLFSKHLNNKKKY